MDAMPAHPHEAGPWPKGLSLKAWAQAEAPPVLGLRQESEAAGIRFIAKLMDHWASGANRFDQAGEGLWLLWDEHEPVAFVGLNVDPYLGRPEVGRIRHLYVAKAWRRHGLARALVAWALEQALPHFEVVTLRSLDEQAAAFYRQVGFHESPRFDQATHWWPLKPLRG